MKISKTTRNTINENAEALKTAKDAVTSAIEDYNAKREDLRETLQTLRDELQGDYDEKSERWQAGEKGVATAAWIEDIGEKTTHVEDDAELDLPDIDEVTGFPDEPEE
jgi:uncharacterized coiled-coil DUF342 family protein